jgi:hypothetical protein
MGPFYFISDWSFLFCLSFRIGSFYFIFNSDWSFLYNSWLGHSYLQLGLGLGLGHVSPTSLPLPFENSKNGIFDILLNEIPAIRYIGYYQWWIVELMIMRIITFEK